MKDKFLHNGDKFVEIVDETTGVRMTYLREDGSDYDLTGPYLCHLHAKPFSFLTDTTYVYTCGCEGNNETGFHEKNFPGVVYFLVNKGRITETIHHYVYENGEKKLVSATLPQRQLL